MQARNRAAPRKAFDDFHRWGAIRAALQILAFGANLGIIAVQSEKNRWRISASSPAAGRSSVWPDSGPTWFN